MWLWKVVFVFVGGWSVFSDPLYQDLEAIGYEDVDFSDYYDAEADPTTFVLTTLKNTKPLPRFRRFGKQSPRPRTLSHEELQDIKAAVQELLAGHHVYHSNHTFSRITLDGMSRTNFSREILDRAFSLKTMTTVTSDSRVKRPQRESDDFTDAAPDNVTRFVSMKLPERSINKWETQITKTIDNKVVTWSDLDNKISSAISSYASNPSTSLQTSLRTDLQTESSSEMIADDVRNRGWDMLARSGEGDQAANRRFLGFIFNWFGWGATTTTTPEPTTPSETPSTEPTTHRDFARLANATVVAKCFVCGLWSTEIPTNSYCGDAFAGEFLPLVPVDPLSRAHVAKFRRYCRYFDVERFFLNGSQPRSIYGRFTGGCSVRWIDLTAVYTQRACRNTRRPMMGKHFASKRMAKLELALRELDDGCIASPMSSLVPLSRGISLYARFHACVCTGSWCNRSAPKHQWNLSQLSLFILWTISNF